MTSVTGSVEAVVAAAAAAVEAAAVVSAAGAVLLLVGLLLPPHAAATAAKAATMPRAIRRRTEPSIRSLQPVWERSQKGERAESTPS